MATIGFLRLEIKGYTIEDLVKVLGPRFGGAFTRLYEHKGRTVLGILMDSMDYGHETGVSIILRAEQDRTTLEVVGFAGGSGWFARDGGSNKQIVQVVEALLKSEGFPIARVTYTQLKRHSPEAEEHYRMIESLPGDEPS